ncbi:MAG TPA: hypothetical protein VJV75_11535 [Candidatus Polarisedimenticolia bacterium]|nr:hypothetical protein [Candidatus Polarisedimenticolia bacterium]
MPDDRVYSPEQLREPKQPGEIIASLHNDITSSEWILGRLHRSWFEDLLWYYGEHYLDWNPATRRFQPRPGKQIVPRSTTNLILGMCEIGMQIVLDSLPKARYSPTTPDQADRNAADCATGIIQYRDQEGAVAQKRADLAGWVVICGTGYVQAGPDLANAPRVKVPQMIQGPPDPNTGEPTEVQATDPVTGELAFDEMPLWDEGVEVLSPFEICPDWNARYPWEWRRYTHVRARTMDWIAATFGSAVREKVKTDAHPSTTVGTMGYYQQKVLDIQMRAGSSGSYGLPYGYSGGALADFKYMEDSAIVMSRYQLPSDKYPDGRFLVTCADQVLVDDVNPHKDKLNLFTFRWSVLPGSNHGFGMVRNLISPQKRLNGIDTQTDYHRKTMGSARVIADRRSQVALDLTTADPAHIVTYKGKGGVPPPQPWPAQSLTTDARVQRDGIVRDMERISGVKPPLDGTAPPGVTANVSLETLQELSGLRFKRAVEENREMFRRLYDMRIKLAQQAPAWKVKRPVPIVGADNKIQMRDFHAADFSGNMTVDVEAVPITALSQAVKKQSAMALLGSGLIDASREQNRDRIRALFGVSEFTDGVDLHCRMAQDENRRMAQGVPVQRQPFDNDPIHLEEHIESTKTAEFQSLPPMLKELRYAHIQEHLAAQQQAQEVQAAAFREATLRAQGAGGGAGPSGSGAGEPGPAAPPDVSGEPAAGEAIQ